MEIYTLYLLLGVLAGFVGGLLGLGGGVVIVPLLIIAFTAQGFDDSTLTHLAIGTSLATIVVTSISATWVHHCKKAVLWSAFVQLAPGVALGAVLGGVIAALLSGAVLQLIFGVLMVAVSIQFGLGVKPAAHRNLPGAFGNTSAGSIIGVLSALFGIGGGSLTTPYLLWCNVSIHRAIATSAACGLPIGLFSAASFMAAGWEKELPAGSLGFVYMPAFLGIAIAATLSARWGAALAHRLPAQLLKRLFALVILAFGIRFIWLNAADLWGNSV
ncbi:sulfite exporter TauE/SafE family protein [Porticoccus sp. W117]|uniref:sulfite exporter TauE/SafE family protein n=1 Tax=Porticoccus sp. W117 TaxID=3054777 RepID=UPI002595FD74|nr:sulfite exporter TauE/SafE family protein [Porticoccus sp. W117]MDM3870580.1 sulfite exporter TauE/SafE family protein [Porticoccus sp. W117]